MPELQDSEESPGDTVTAVVVIGIEPMNAPVTISDFEVAVQRLERAVRPWDAVVNLAPSTIGVICTALSNAREVDGIAARLADVVRAPMMVGEEVRQLGACVGAAVVAEGEEPIAAFARAREAMRQMRAARDSLVVPPPA